MLTPEDAAAVLRRAAELDTPVLPVAGPLGGLDESAVREAAREVGMSDAAVEQAVAEWRAGALAPLPPLPPDRWAGLPGSVVAERTLALTVPETTERLAGWLRGQLYALRRRRGQEQEWAPRGGVLAQARRAADLDRRLRLRSVDRLRVCVLPSPEGSRVRLVADLSATRSGLLLGLVAGPAVLAGLGTVSLLGGPAPELLLVVPSAAGAGGAGWLAARRSLAGRRSAVADELEAALDELAATASPRALVDRVAGWALGRALRRRTSPTS